MEDINQEFKCEQTIELIRVDQVNLVDCDPISNQISLVNLSVKSSLVALCIV